VNENINACNKSCGNRNRHQQFHQGECLCGPADSARQQAVYQAAESCAEEINTQDGWKYVCRIDNKGYIANPEDLTGKGGQAVEKSDGQQRFIVMVNTLCLANRDGSGSYVPVPGNRQCRNSNHKINNDGQKVSRSQTKCAYEPKPACQTADRGAEGIDTIQQTYAEADGFI
jgi:hypothetical protein